jgi:hypothetical protein
MFERCTPAKAVAAVAKRIAHAAPMLPTRAMGPAYGKKSNAASTASGVI